VEAESVTRVSSQEKMASCLSERPEEVDREVPSRVPGEKRNAAEVWVRVRGEKKMRRTKRRAA
jgi:hypothetical protein